MTDETPAGEIPFLNHMRAQFRERGPDAFDELFDKVAVYVQGCESGRDAFADRAQEWRTAAGAAQAALVHATNRLAEADALVAELRPRVIRRVTDDRGSPHYFTGTVHPEDDGAEFATAEELNQLVKAHGIACADNAAWQGRYDRIVAAVREYHEAHGFAGGVDAAFREALGIA